MVASIGNKFISKPKLQMLSQICNNGLISWHSYSGELWCQQVNKNLMRPLAKIGNGKKISDLFEVLIHH